MKIPTHDADFISYNAVLAIEIDPTNWKGHWRKGVALMSMAKRQFRTKQAIDAFTQCSECSSLPPNKKAEVANELSKARARYAQQDAEVSIAANGFIHMLRICAFE